MMRGLFALALAGGTTAVLLAACNVLTGASALGTCTGDCTEIGPAGGGDAGDAPTVTRPDGAVVLPPCTTGQTSCAGRVAAECVGGAWKQTICDQTCNAGKCAPWLSCRNAAGPGCGPNGTSCCATSAVPGGTFNRRNLAASPATVSKFDLELYEVTVGRFRAFVDAGGGTRVNPPGLGAGAHPKIANSGWQQGWSQLLVPDSTALRTKLRHLLGTWTDAPGANEHLPINYVSWFDAFAFCAYDDARLPTNAEWGFTASGGSEQRLYPWSTPPTSAVIAQRSAYNCNFTPPEMSCSASYCSTIPTVTPCNAVTCVAPASCVYPPCTGCTLSDIAPVGALPLGVGRWGHFDLSGNVGELVLDIDGNGELPTPCTDCALLTSTTGKGDKSDFIFNGGAWNFASSSSVRSISYDTVYSNDTRDNVGFRCARD